MMANMHGLLANEQLLGKLLTNTLHNHDDNDIPQISSIPDEPGCPSRFQMIRVDRNFGRGRWKVNDYEPPESTSVAMLPPVNTIENESIPLSNNSLFSNLTASNNMPIGGFNDSNATSSATLTATAASAAAAAATAFQQQQQIMALNNTPTLPVGNIPHQHGLIHAYSSPGLANQPYILANHHHQFGYYPFYPSPYSHYAHSWAAHAIPFLPPPHMAPPQQQTASQFSSTNNLNDPTRLTETDNNSDNSVMSSIADYVSNSQNTTTTPFLPNVHHPHSTFVPQTSTAVFHHPSHGQMISNNAIDMQQFYQAPMFSSLESDGTTKSLMDLSLGTATPQTKPFAPPMMIGMHNGPSTPTHLYNSISSSEAIHPIGSPAATLCNIWPYSTASPSLTLSQTAQTAAVTAAAAMGLLNSENNQSTGIANEILKEILTTPAKQNNTADIGNKISAAMDLVKMHLLSAVREEVTDLRQQIRTLNEKINGIEHENTFLRQHVSNEIYAQYTPLLLGLSFVNDSNDSTTTNSISSIPIASVPINTPLLA